MYNFPPHAPPTPLPPNTHTQENGVWHFTQTASLVTICIKSQILFPRKNKKDIVNLSLVEFGQSVVGQYET